MPRGARKVAVPAAARDACGWPRVDFSDAYGVAVPDSCNVDDVARAMMTSAPGPFRALMWLRDRIAGVFGLKRSDALAAAPAAPADRPLQPGDFVSFFRLERREGDVLVFGERDRHLDFKLVVTLRDAEATASTFVVKNNLLGRAYFFIVRPFHARIVPAMLDAGARRLAVDATVSNAAPRLL